MDIPCINCLGKTFPGTKLKVKFQLWLLEESITTLEIMISQEQTFEEVF